MADRPLRSARPAICDDGAVSQFELETAVTRTAPGTWSTQLCDAWNIGDTANGGFAAAPVVRACAELAERPDPLSVTTHFLRPVRPERVPVDATIDAGIVKSGRVATQVAGSLAVDGRTHLSVVAVMGELDGEPEDDEPAITVPAPSIPSAEHCVDRSELAQGVDLPILGRLDVRIHPDRVVPAGSADAVIDGWIRFADLADATALGSVLFCDAFPPSLYPRFGRIGWVPTLELTVHVRRRPAPGWVQARFECDDLHDGRMIETGALWDSTGALIARSRQLGLLLPAD